MQLAKPDPLQTQNGEIGRLGDRLGDVSRPEDIEGKGTLTNTEWANELHPKPRGFNKVARVCWGPAFAAAGLLP